MSEETVARLIATLPPEDAGVALLCAGDAAVAAETAARGAGLPVESFDATAELLAALGPAGVRFVLCEGTRLPDAGEFAEAVKARSPGSRVALVLDGEPRRGAALPRGVDHFVVRPVAAATLAALLAEFLDTRRRMRALEAFSLMSRKQEIIGEISSFNTHLKSITHLKDRAREFEERIGELEEAKERLAAEIRARDAELRALRERLARSGESEAALRRELAEAEARGRSSAGEVDEGVAALAEVRDRLLRLRDAAPLPASPPAHAAARIRELEARLETADRIFGRILAVVGDFVAAETPDIERVFDEITAALVEFTEG